MMTLTLNEAIDMAMLYQSPVAAPDLSAEDKQEVFTAIARTLRSNGMSVPQWVDSSSNATTVEPVREVSPAEQMQAIMDKGKQIPEDQIAGWRTNPETHTVFPITEAQEKAHPVQDMAKHLAIVQNVAEHVTGTRGGDYQRTDPQAVALLGKEAVRRMALAAGHAGRADDHWTPTESSEDGPTTQVGYHHDARARQVMRGVTWGEPLKLPEHMHWDDAATLLVTDGFKSFAREEELQNKIGEYHGLGLTPADVANAKQRLARFGYMDARGAVTPAGRTMAKTLTSGRIGFDRTPILLTPRVGYELEKDGTWSKVGAGAQPIATPKPKAAGATIEARGNYLYVKFPGKPDEATLNVVRKLGMKWEAPTKTWRAQNSGGAEAAIRRALGMGDGKPTDAEIRAKKEDHLKAYAKDPNVAAHTIQAHDLLPETADPKDHVAAAGLTGAALTGLHGVAYGKGERLHAAMAGMRSSRSWDTKRNAFSTGDVAKPDEYAALQHAANYWKDVHSGAKAAGEAIPKRVNMYGEEYDVVGRNPDGTMKLRNDAGGEFDTNPEEKVTLVAPRVKEEAPVDPKTMTRAAYIVHTVNSGRAKAERQLDHAVDAILQEYKPLGVTGKENIIASLMGKQRKTPEERALLAEFSTANRNYHLRTPEHIAQEAGAAHDLATRGSGGQTLAEKLATRKPTETMQKIAQKISPQKYAEDAAKLYAEEDQQKELAVKASAKPKRETHKEKVARWKEKDRLKKEAAIQAHADLLESDRQTPTTEFHHQFGTSQVPVEQQRSLFGPTPTGKSPDVDLAVKARDYKGKREYAVHMKRQDSPDWELHPESGGEIRNSDDDTSEKTYDTRQWHPTVDKALSAFANIHHQDASFSDGKVLEPPDDLSEEDLQNIEFDSTPKDSEHSRKDGTTRVTDLRAAKAFHDSAKTHKGLADDD